MPLYEQLYRSLSGWAGALPAGTRDAGQAQPDSKLSVSINTVDTAYQMLAEGYLESRPPKRILCAAKPCQPPLRGVRADAASPGSSGTAGGCNMSTRGRNLGCSRHGPGRGSKELLYSSPQLLAPGDAQGDLGRRSQPGPVRGVRCGAHQIVVGAGLGVCWGCWPRCCPARRQWKRPATRGQAGWKTTGCPVCLVDREGMSCRRWKTSAAVCYVTPAISSTENAGPPPTELLQLGCAGAGQH